MTLVGNLYNYLQLVKPSGYEIEMPIHKRLVIDNFEGIAKRTLPLGLIGLKLSMLLSRENTVINTLVPKISQKNPKLEGYA